MKYWKSFSIRGCKQEADALQAFLESFDALSVTLEDAEDQPLLEPLPGETPIWDQIVITALFSEEFNEKKLMNALEKKALPYAYKTVEDQLWEVVWQKDFSPRLFGEILWVVPTWCTPPEPDKPYILMDPGLAFGSGTHPTTALCLEWLAHNSARLKESTLLDFGCGSGILAIAAAKLGAKLVYGIDIDPQALISTQNNAEQNQVNKKIQTGFADFKTPQVDVLIANILANPLKALSLEMKSRLKPQGVLALSGIMSDQANEVILAYEPWINLNVSQTKEGWVILSGVNH